MRIDFAATQHSKLEWGPQTDLTMDDVIASNNDSSKEKGAPTLDKAKEWLEAKLGDGPVKATELFNEADTRSVCGADTLRRAAKELGVKIEKRGFPAYVVWSL